MENGLKWLKIGKNGDNANMPHQKCIRSQKKKTSMEKSPDYGSMSKVAQKDARRAAAPPGALFVLGTG